MEGLEKNPDKLLDSNKESLDTVPIKDEGLVPPPTGEAGEKKEPICSVPTINFNDFVSLLAPCNVDKCLCCSIPLLSSGPPPIFPEKKSNVLKSFCDILNLPFSFARRKKKSKEVGEDVEDEKEEGEEEEEEEDLEDFPFCYQCTNKKVLLLNLVHQKLKILQEQFDKLKDGVIRDILRGFVTNLIVERKLPVEVIRETKVCERMYQLFKRHSENQTKKSCVDSEVQTEISSVSTPLLNPSAVASLLENTGGLNNNRKRKIIPPRKPESFASNNSLQKSWNSTTRRIHSNSSYDKQKHSPMKISSNHGGYYSMKNTQSFVEETIVPFDEQMNGGLFGDNSILNLDENDSYMPNADYNYSKGSFDNINGVSTIDSEEYQTALGGYDPEGNIELPLEKKHSPLTYTDLDSIEADTPKPQFNEERSRSRSKIMAECEICGKTMLKATIKMHMEQIHGDAKPHQCRGCDRRFARRDHFLSHEERHVVNSKRLYFCHRCVEHYEIIPSKTAYISHCTTKHGIEDDVVEHFHFCDAEACNESYKVKEDFLNHLKSHWKLGESFKCGDCDKCFAVEKRLIAHQSQAHGDKIDYYDCQFCYMGFEEEIDFSRHILFHKVKIPNELVHACDKCDKSFETLNRLQRHVYSVHVRVRKRKSRRTESSSNIDPDEELELNESVDGIDEDSHQGSIAEKPDFECQKCGKVYTADFSLKRHQKRNPNCGVQQAPKSKLEEGSSDDDIPDAGEVDAEEDEDFTPSKPKTRRKSSGKVSSTKPKAKDKLSHACSYCSGSWKANIELRRHLVNNHRSKHLKLGQVFCVVCFYVFDSQELLDEHCDDRHSKFKCNICNKQLQNSGILKQHMERHKVSPFMCKVCGEGFPTKATLKMHNSKKHQKSRNGKNDISNTESPANTLHEDDQDSIEMNMMDLFQL